MQNKKYSLRRRLLARVAVPLFFLLAIGGIGTFMLARHMGSIVYDHWLFDSAMTMAAQLKTHGAEVVLDLPKTAIEMFEWDSTDRIYEEVRSQKKGTIFLNATFPAPPATEHFDEPVYYDAIINQLPVRVVAVNVVNPADSMDVIHIQVAETRNKRGTLVKETLLLSMPFLLGLLLAAGIFIWFAITSSLNTLDKIAIRLADYEPENLMPVEDTNIPSEVSPLVSALNKLIGKLSLAQNAQRRFVSNAAHQLRTPLATLQVQTERALREFDPLKHSEALSHVLNAVTRLRHVVRQILTLARSEHKDESGTGTAAPVQVDLTVLAREELERWADVAISRNIDLGYEGPETGIEVAGDPHLLRELIGNLVDNAIRYGRQDGIVTLGLTDSPVTLYVDDDGAGIPLEERSLVMDRFYRRSESHGEGCGLGLAIAQEIAARHGAQLNITDSPLNSGSRFFVVFPSRVVDQA